MMTSAALLKLAHDMRSYSANVIVLLRTRATPATANPFSHSFGLSSHGTLWSTYQRLEYGTYMQWTTLTNLRKISDMQRGNMAAAPPLHTGQATETSMAASECAIALALGVAARVPSVA
eukprot:2053426-Amphidinium_carterae.1